MGAQPGGLCRAAPPWRHVGQVWVPRARQGGGWSRLPNPQTPPQEGVSPSREPTQLKGRTQLWERHPGVCPSPICAEVWPLRAAPGPGLCHPQPCTGLRRKSPRARSEELLPPLPGGTGLWGCWALTSHPCLGRGKQNPLVPPQAEPTHRVPLGRSLGHTEGLPHPVRGEGF